MVLALDITCDAVDRYKELCEGAYCGKSHCLTACEYIANHVLPTCYCVCCQHDAL